jgi:hypothetical protein
VPQSAERRDQLGVSHVDLPLLGGGLGAFGLEDQVRAAEKLAAAALARDLRYF